MSRPQTDPKGTRPPVVLTRAPEDNARLASLLRERGHDVLECPALAIATLPFPGGAAALAARFGAASCVVFTSRRGVEAADALLGDGPSLVSCLEQRPVIAGGPATARCLRRHGVSVSLEGTGTQGAAVEVPALLAQLGSASIGSVLLIRSDAADEALPVALTRAGLAVDDIKLHAPIAPPACLLEPRQIAAVACASPSAARRVLEWNPWMAELPFVAIGPVTAQVLSVELGVELVVTAGRPDDQALAEAIEEAVSRSAAASRARAADANVEPS